MSQKQAVKYDNQLSCSRTTSLFPISIYFFSFTFSKRATAAAYDRPRIRNMRASSSQYGIPPAPTLSPSHTIFLPLRSILLFIVKPLCAQLNILFGSPAASTFNAHSYPANTYIHTHIHIYRALPSLFDIYFIFGWWRSQAKYLNFCHNPLFLNVRAVRSIDWMIDCLIDWLTDWLSDSAQISGKIILKTFLLDKYK